MVVSNAIFGSFIGGPGIKRTPSNAEKTAFIDPEEEVIEATVLSTEERKPYIYSQNTQNNPEHRNSEGFFTQDSFSKSAPPSQTVAANVSQFYAASDRSFTAGSTKYGSSGSSSFSPSNKAAGQVGRQFASIA